jgi:L-seryl-tRNA(Ser) seleniumtransferase
MPDLRKLPSVDRLLKLVQELSWSENYPRDQIVESLRLALGEAREHARLNQSLPDQDWLLQRCEQHLVGASRSSLVPMINATGVILHTNLGRAPLSPRALEHVRRVCQGYCNLEFDLESGARGHRHKHLESLLGRLTGAAACLVVNNCAAALLMIVDEFARGREVVVSRGELVEIGGSFRIPEVLTRGGAVLREVGCTNRTYVADFEKAISSETAAILSTHLSNFSQEGFVHRPDPRELVRLAHQRGVLSILDLGSGLLEGEQLPRNLAEPDVAETVEEGWDLIAFSGDKLLGGAQAGIILGKPELIARLAKNPWMRALRLDKLRLAALEGTLLDHLLSPMQIPTVGMLAAPATEIRAKAQVLLRRLSRQIGEGVKLEVKACHSSVGGGTTPGQLLDSWALCVQPSEGGLDGWMEKLRSGEPSVLARRSQDWLWFDLRTVAAFSLKDLERKLLQLWGDTP